MASMTRGRIPSLKLGTHSTNDVDDNWAGRGPFTMCLHSLRGCSQTALNHSDPHLNSILELTVGELLERLGSSDPAPGGGAAAALVGALGAALVQMTANLTIGRPKLADVEAQARGIETRAA